MCKLCRRSSLLTQMVRGTVLLTLLTAQACSPGWTPDVFVRKYRPDVPRDYYSGRLGILQETYYRFNLVAAYRYLNGGVLAASEVVPDRRWDYQSEGDPESDSYAWRQTREDAAQPEDGSARWSTMRAQFAADAIVSPTVEHAAPGAENQYEQFTNCTPGAFATAANTLAKRVSMWGKDSPLLQDWIRGQDAVFHHCDDDAAAMPVPAPAGAPLLLKQDRVYQIAAAEFYALRFEAARVDFRWIAEDKASPWSAIAPFLVARTMVREAMLAGKPLDTGAVSFDSQKLTAARDELLRLKRMRSVPDAYVDPELGYVQSRLEPDGRIAAAAVALAGPKPDGEFQQDLLDLVFLLDQRLDGYPRHTDFGSTEDLRKTAPMVDWVLTFQSRTEEARRHAVQQWASTKTLPWLVAAMAKAEPGDAETPALLQAVAGVKKTSPAWQTVTYHRARLMAAGNAKSARELLEAMLKEVRVSGPLSTENAVTALRMRLAVSFADFLNYVPRRDLVPSGEYAWAVKNCVPCAKDVGPLQFDEDEAGFFNRQATLAMWMEAAQSAALPADMRRALVLAGWTRAVVLDDGEAARKFSAMREGVKGMPMLAPDRGFAAWLTILRNPGLRYTLDAGVQRSQMPDELNAYRDNWWGDSCANQPDCLTDTVPITFMDGVQRAEAKHELQRLSAAKNATSWLGRRVIEYAQAHPADRDVPEALHLVVRASRYGAADAGISAEAFRLLHKVYPQSAWTAKTPYHF